MKYLIVLFVVAFLFVSCSKQESCYCNVGDGEYSYLPLSNQIQDPGTSVNTFGDIEQECELEDARLKQTKSSNAYCEMK